MKLSESLDKLLARLATWATTGDDRSKTGDIMQQISWERDMAARVDERLADPNNSAVWYAVGYSLTALEEISSVEVLTGDDHRIREARWVLRYLHSKVQ